MDEFQFIEKIRSKYSLQKLGDDCAVLPFTADHDLLMTADLLIADIDFRMEWTTPEFLGHKALAVSLSDIAAMGGTPKWSLLSIGVPEHIWNTEYVERFYEGWHALAVEFGVELVGGDVSRSPDRLVIDSMVGGEVPREKSLLRSGARPGDAIFVSGTLGGAAGGLKLLDQGIRYGDDLPDVLSDLLLKQLKPQPEVSLANILQRLGIVTSAIDVSDGLSSDLWHMCRESGVGARIYADRLPIDPGLEQHFHADDRLQLALNGGEDFGLLFTVNPDASTADLPGVTRIGEITAIEGAVEFIPSDSPDVSENLQPEGYRHF